MFLIESDLSLHVTRGDAVCFSLGADGPEGAYRFQVGDLVRFRIFQRKNCENVLLCRDFPVYTEAETVTVALSETDTRLGGIINRPTDYWYEIELNPHGEPQTIVGYDADGPKIFRLYPEGADFQEAPPDPEDMAPVDDRLSLSSTRPVQNQAVAREIAKIWDAIQEGA